MCSELDKGKFVVKFFDLSDAEFREAYVEEAFIADVQHDIDCLMKEKGVTRAELARRLKVSAPYVTQILGNEDANLTLRTIARVYAALGERACIFAEKRSEQRPSRKAARPLGGDDWSRVGANDPWRQEEELNRPALANSSGSGKDVVVWLDAVRRRAA